MQPLFSVSIKTPQKTIFDGRAQSIVAPGAIPADAKKIDDRRTWD